MKPIVALLGLGAVGALGFVAVKKAQAQSSGETDEPVRNHVVGPSSVPWIVESMGVDSDNIAHFVLYTDYSPPQKILEYVQTPGDNNSRMLLNAYVDASNPFIDEALSDFGILNIQTP